MPRVVLDAGHGGNDIGIYYNNRMEKTDALRLALRVGEILEEYNVDVEYTRQEDIYLSQIQRLELANKSKADLLVSFHRLSGPNVSNRPGLSFYVGEDDPLSIEAANNIGNQLARIGYEDYGIIIRSELPLLSYTEMPDVMLSIGYMETQEGNELFDRDFKAIAQEIAQGILFTLAKERPSEISNLCQRCSASRSHDGDASACSYSILTGPFQNYEVAIIHQRKVHHLGYYALIVEEKHQFLLRIGSFTDLEDAIRLEKILHNKGLCTLITND